VLRWLPFPLKPAINDLSIAVSRREHEPTSHTAILFLTRLRRRIEADARFAPALGNFTGNTSQKYDLLYFLSEHAEGKSFMSLL